ncbi:MAG: IPT/TIG domain-containing protein [Thermoanaerobaculales bacterium]|nr:IPT/TIG domain-containing protein [Thermoanaerobaculales bacterium]
MNKFLSGIAILAVVMAAGCSGDSSRPQDPGSGVTPATWSITALNASDPNPFVGSVVQITASVTKDGSAAPDGTTVDIIVGGPSDDAVYGLGTVGNYSYRLATSGGQVSTSLVAQTAGAYVVQAKVNTASRQTAVQYKERDQSDALQIVPPLLPNRGAYDGGEQVLISAKGLIAPVEVDFIVNGTTFPAVVDSVEESNPLSAAGSVTIRTPHVTDVDFTVSHEATLVLRGGVDTAGQQQAQLPEAFTYLAEAEFLIYQPVDPNSGSFEGGELITLTGRAIKAQAVVVFNLGGQAFEGITQSVTESLPTSGDGSIVVETPHIPPGLRPVDGNNQPIGVTIDLTVTVAADTANAQVTTVPSAFTFLPPDVPPEPIWKLLAPSFYLALPDYGASSGGETITILGRDFRAQLIGTDGVTVLDTAPAVEFVKFGDVEGVVQSVSVDGTQIQVMTPRFSITPLPDDQSVTISIRTYHSDSNGGDALGNNQFDISRANAFIVLADEPTPSITALAPIAGPIDGGSQVTIFGSGFQAPAQVTFGVLEAINVEVNDDQSLEDQDTIICVTPDYSQQGATPPLAVDVVVRNVLSGKVSNSVTFTYGDNLFITGNTPVEGGAGTQIIIYGSGFEDPLMVDFVPGTAGGGGLGSIRLEVVTVSGTELLVRFPVDAPISCTNIDGFFRMTDVESQAVAEGGTFTYLGSNPFIYGVEPIFVQEGDDGDSVSPDDIVIRGEFFNPELLVEINNFRIASDFVTVIDSGTIEVSQIPAPNDFGLVWDTSSCVTDDGLTGIRETPTLVDVTVINLPGECRETLPGGLVYEPEDPTCVVAPSINVVPPVFPDTPAGTCSAGQVMLVQNLGQGTLEVQSVTLLGRFFFDAGASSQVSGAMTVPSFGTDTSLVVHFCPDIENQIYNGEAVFVSNDPNSPTTVSLFGIELQEPLIQTAPFGHGDTWTFPLTAAGNCSPNQSLTISNNGDADLELGSIVADAPFSIVTAPLPTVISPAQNAIIELQFCPTVDDGGLQTGLLTINSNDIANTPVLINLQGQEQP